MDKPVYVYWLKTAADILQQRINTHLGASTFFWVANAARLQLGKGMPADWDEQGAVFNEQGEIRWRADGNGYEVLLLTEHPISDLQPLPGEWDGAETEDIFLQDLNERRVYPNFAAYPHGKDTGRLKARVYRHNGIVTFVSLRAFLSDTEGGLNDG
jgi:hypothetical protein